MMIKKNLPAYTALIAVLLILLSQTVQAECYPYSISGLVTYEGMPADGANTILILNSTQILQDIVGIEGLSNKSGTYLFDLRYLSICPNESDILTISATFKGEQKEKEIKINTSKEELNPEPINIKELVNPQIEVPKTFETIIGKTIIFTAKGTNPNNEQLLWSAEGLPNNASFQSSTGEFEWTPDEVGEFSLKILLSDGKAPTQRSTIKIIVLPIPSPLNIEQIPPQIAIAGKSYIYELKVSGGAGELSYSLDGDVPPGLDINDKGIISLRPSRENRTYSIEIEVKDSYNNNASQTMNLTVVTCEDNDNDNYYSDGPICGPVDCDDFNPNTHPYADERKNGIDDNCNTIMDEGLIFGPNEWRESENETKLQSVEFDCSGDETECFKGNVTTKISYGQELEVEFDWNCDKFPLNLSSVRTTPAIVDGRNSLIVNIPTVSVDKTIYLRRNTSYNSVCIKDEDINSVSEISSTCTGSNEQFIICDSESNVSNNSRVNGYTCTIIDDGNKYRISGLKHSAVIEQNYAEPKKSTSGRSSSSASKKSTAPAAIPICIPWSECDNSKRTRVCIVNGTKKTETISCIVPNQNSISDTESVSTAATELEEVSDSDPKQTSEVANVSSVIADIISENASNNAFGNKKNFNIASPLLTVMIIIIVGAGVIAGYLSFKEK